MSGRQRGPISEEDLVIDEAERGFSAQPEPLTAIGHGESYHHLAAAAQRDDADDSLPRVVLVCKDCDEFYEHDDEWLTCPKCGAGLAEVDRA